MIKIVSFYFLLALVVWSSVFMLIGYWLAQRENKQLRCDLKKLSDRLNAPMHALQQAVDENTPKTKDKP